jgi:hypothetical protein
MWQNWWDGGSWPWTDSGVPSPTVGIGLSLGAVSVLDSFFNPNSGRPHVFVLGSDGHLWQCWWDGGNWSWADVGVPSQTVGIMGAYGAVVAYENAMSGGRPYVFVLGTDVNLWQCWWDGGSWLWSNQGTPTPTTGIVASLGATVVDRPSRPYSYVLGTDGHLWQNWWDDKTWHWNDVGVPSATVGIAGAIGAGTSNLGPYTFVLGSDGNLWNAYWNGSGFQWDNHGKPTATVGIERSMGTIAFQGEPLAFVRGTDGHLWQNAKGSNSGSWAWLDLGA